MKIKVTLKALMYWGNGKISTRPLIARTTYENPLATTPGTKTPMKPRIAEKIEPIALNIVPRKLAIAENKPPSQSGNGTGAPLGMERTKSGNRTRCENSSISK
jgi:hypothetical protein